MYKCEICGLSTEKSQVLLKVTTEVRHKTYIEVGKYGDETKIGEGTEIAADKKVCSLCYESHKSTQPRVVESKVVKTLKKEPERYERERD